MNGESTVPEPAEENFRLPEPGELFKFGSVYFFVALIELQAKLSVTRAWFDGTLDGNHRLLLAFQYTNNEQSRLLQFYIPEAFVRLLGLSVITCRCPILMICKRARRSCC